MTFYERLLRQAYEAIERLMELLRTYTGADKGRYTGLMPAYATASATPGYGGSSYDALR